MNSRRLVRALVILASLLPALIFPGRAYAAPSITVSPRAGAAGTVVSVFGSNFFSYTGDRLDVLFGDTAVASVASVASDGGFMATFTVPARAVPGNITVAIRDTAGQTIAQEIFSVPFPEIRLNTWGGTPGIRVTATCKGFYAGKPVTLHYYYDERNYDEVGTGIAGPTGECAIQFDVPASWRGAHTITAANSELQSDSAGFEVLPTAVIEPGTASVGDRINVKGMGFAPLKEVSVSLYDQKVAYATTNARGSFIAQFIVPVMRAGTYPLKIEDPDEQLKWVELVLTARLVLSKTAGEIGAKVTATGTGFEPNSIVLIKYDTTEMAVMLADNDGGFTATFAVPVSTSGPHVVTATDGLNTRQGSYAVESDPPARPEVQSPKNGDAAQQPLTLHWEAVYDISGPLVYTLQLARTSDFARPLMEKTGLSVSQYALGSDEALLPNRRKTFYYWRVRATDGAGNVGPWSEPAQFSIPSDTMPDWSRWLLVLVDGVVGLVMLARVIRLATVKRPPAA